MPKIKLSTNIIWPIVVLLIAFGAFYFKPWQTKPQETISVTAEGKTDITPDVAKITASVESKNPNLDTARAENEKKVSTIVSKLKEVGIDEKDIKTQNISGAPGYEPQTLIYPPQPRPNTNVFSTSLEITIRDFKKTDSVLSTLTQNGATNLYGPQLTIGDDKLEEAKSRAREAAVGLARKKAGELAKASGRSVGKVVKITEQGDFGYPVPIIARGGAELQQKASQIQPGQNEVTINLAVDFALK